VVSHRLKQYEGSAQILVIEAGPDISDNKDISHFKPLNFIVASMIEVIKLFLRRTTMVDKLISYPERLLVAGQ
jgi:hypothetical protein